MPATKNQIRKPANSVVAILPPQNSVTKKKMLAGKSNPCETFCKGETNSLEFNGSIDDGEDYSDLPF